MQWLWALTVVLPSVRRGHEIWQSENYVVRNCLHCGMGLEGRRVGGGLYLMSSLPTMSHEL